MVSNNPVSGASRPECIFEGPAKEIMDVYNGVYRCLLSKAVKEKLLLGRDMGFVEVDMPEVRMIGKDGSEISYSSQKIIALPPEYREMVHSVKKEIEFENKLDQMITLVAEYPLNFKTLDKDHSVLDDMLSMYHNLVEEGMKEYPSVIAERIASFVNLGRFISAHMKEGREKELEYIKTLESLLGVE